MYAFENGVLELVLRLWNPPCGAVLQGIWLGLTISRLGLVLSVRVRVKVMLPDRGMTRVRGLGSALACKRCVYAW